MHEKRAQFNDGENGQKAGSLLDAEERPASEQPVSAIAQKSLRSKFPADQGRLAPVNNVRCGRSSGAGTKQAAGDPEPVFRFARVVPDVWEFWQERKDVGVVP